MEQVYLTMKKSIVMSADIFRQWSKYKSQIGLNNSRTKIDTAVCLFVKTKPYFTSSAHSQVLSCRRIGFVIILYLFKITNLWLVRYNPKLYGSLISNLVKTQRYVLHHQS